MKCPNCSNDNQGNALYCTDCGYQIRGERIDYEDKNKKYFIQTLILFLCLIIILVTSNFIEISLLKHDFVFTGLLGLIVILFGLLNIKSFLTIFRFSIHYKLIIFLLLGAPILAIIISYFSRFISHLLGINTLLYSAYYNSISSNGMFYCILYVSIFPGIIEELLFRGILFNHLKRLTSLKSTIIITSVTFAFLHFSFISIIWLSLIGLILGYLRARYRTIWYGIFFHAFYNLCIIILESYI